MNPSPGAVVRSSAAELMTGCFVMPFLSSLRSARKNCKREERNKWEHLPPELLRSIAEYLPIPDHLRVRVVCPSWALALRNFVPSEPLPHFPWLMLTKHTTTPYDREFSFLQHSTQGGSHLSLHMNFSTATSCIGYRDGWLVILHDSVKILLLNPLTGDTIPLPSRRSANRINRVRKVVLSASPSADASDFVAVLITDRGTLSFVRKGGNAWTPIRAASATASFHDVVHHNGYFIAVSSDALCDSWARLEIFGITAPSIYTSGGSVTTIAAYDYKRDPLEYEYNRFRNRAYLVSASSGLLQILGYKDSEDCVQFKYFVVLKFSAENTVRSCWEKINDLGEDSLFLDANNSLCLSAEVVPELRRNCIYFANRYTVGDGEFDVGIFDVERIAIESCFTCKVHLPAGNPMYPPIWFMPSLT